MFTDDPQRESHMHGDVVFVCCFLLRASLPFCDAVRVPVRWTAAGVVHSCFCWLFDSGEYVCGRDGISLRGALEAGGP